MSFDRHMMLLLYNQAIKGGMKDADFDLTVTTR